jgi:hypothetical protein
MVVKGRRATVDASSLRRTRMRGVGHNERMRGRELTVESLERERVEAARRRTSPDSFREGVALFDRTVRVIRDGIRNEWPGISAHEIARLLRERLRLARTLETR